ncbi:hypothetical protein BH10BDE1_BH10BDE1_33620 [soil metagenome]
MKLSFVAQILMAAFFSFGVRSALAGDDTGRPVRKPAQVLRLDCGTYRVLGVMSMNSQKHFILRLYGQSSLRSELLVIGGELDEKLASVGQRVELEVYVPQPITGTNGDNVVVLRSLKTGSRLVDNEPPLLVNARSCGLSD